ncbi:MAG: hypothetical protein ACM31C_24180 [Acidobacteriota bacterium]
MSQIRLVAAIATALVAASPLARAGEMTKEECLDAHSRGQDAKEQNKLSLARKLFLTCAQPSCPALVQGDCARFADDLGRLQPSMTFVARDGSGADLPDTTVYVDGILVATRLDGSAHDVDPGSHTIKFQSGGKEQMVTVVIGTGEKGRTVAATFGSPSVPSPAAAAARADLAVKKPSGPKTTHPGGAKVLVYGGAVLTAGGAILGVVGLLKMPGNCDLSTHQCAAPPNDPSIANAASAAKLIDYGWAVGITGVIALGAGTYWYLTGAKTEKEHMALAPWASTTGGGFALTGSL